MAARANYTATAEQSFYIEHFEEQYLKIILL
jgi:hypothetical protein